MNIYNFETGEPVIGSPDLSPNDKSDEYAVKAEEFHKTPFNPNPFFTVGDGKPKGYIGPTNPSGVSVGFMNPPIGDLQNGLIYMNSPTTNMGYGYQQQQPQFQGFGIVPPGVYPNGFVGNPAFQLMSQWQQNGYIPNNPYFQNQFLRNPIQYQDRIVHVDGYNPTGSTMLLKSNTDELIEQMQVDMMKEQELAQAKREQRMQGWFNANAYGYNYYGVPYYQNGFDQDIINKYRRKLDDMKQEAIMKRKNLNKNFSRLVHNYLGDDITDQDIDTFYDGYSYTIPGAQIASNEKQEYLSKLQPFENATAYQEADRKITELYQMANPPGRDTNGFLHDLGFVKTMYRLEEEAHRRRDTKQYYDSDIYHRFMRKYALENNIQDPILTSGKSREEILKDVFGENALQEIESLGNKLGTRVNEDGRIEISASEDMKRRLDPNYIQQPVPVVINQNEENDYANSRSKFLESIYAAAKGG